MAIRKPPADPDPPAESESSPAETTTNPTGDEGLVLTARKKKKKKKKRRHSKNLRAHQTIVRAHAKGGRRVARAVFRGLDAWHTESSKSSRKKKDGLIKDAPRNIRRAADKMSKEMSKAPGEALRVLEKRIKTGRLIRGTKFFR